MNSRIHISILLALSLFSINSTLSQSSNDSTAIKLYLDGRINKDSMYHKMYDSGKLDTRYYLNNISDVLFAKEAPIILKKNLRLFSERYIKMRSEARYKAVVDCLSLIVDSAEVREVAQYYDDYQFPSLRKTNDSIALEEYVYAGFFTLYKYKHRQHHMSTYLLVRYYLDDTYSLYPLGSDINNPKVADKMDFHLKHPEARLFEQPEVINFIEQQ